MGHNTLNKKISIPDLPRNPQVWSTPSADILYNDHSIDPSMNELRDEWLSNEIDSNPLISSAERDITESRYGAELGKRAVDLNGIEAEDEELDLSESDDEEKEEGIEKEV